MVQRQISLQLTGLMKQFPAVGLIGPRQSGKTTIARLFQKQAKKECVYFDLESPADLRKFHDPELFLKEHEDVCVIIDEVQRMPELFPLLRHLIDKKRRPGRFLLLGSASPEMIKGASESLAGRIYYLETHPFTLPELPQQKNTMQKHWFRGGFPDAYLAKNDEQWHKWMDGFVRTYIERDLNFLFGVTFSPQVMIRLWRMLAHHHAQMWNAQSFAKGLDVSPTTVNRYLDYLSGAFVVRKLPSFHYNAKKRLVKTPKVYIRDSGILHYLLNIDNNAELKYHASVGHSWEGYALEQIIDLMPNNIQPYFYRTHDGSEMDLVLVKGVKPVACVEIKYSTSPAVSRGMLESITDLKTTRNYIITPSEEGLYPLKDKLKAGGLYSFVEKELPLLLKQV